jgi:hypothetical protein
MMTKSQPFTEQSACVSNYEPADDLVVLPGRNLIV